MKPSNASLHFPAARVRGHRSVLGPENSPLRFVSFSLVTLEAGKSWEFAFAEQEAVLVLLGGKCNIGGAGFTWNHIGGRESVFTGKATSVYLPPGSRGQVEAVTELEAAICAAPAKEGPSAALIRPEDVVIRHVGAQNWKRDVHDIVSASFPAAKLVVGETYTPPGNWSSYPPHKHDEVREDETKLEEVYYFRISPPQGFALQRIYTDDGQQDVTLAMRDGDTVALPKGYHPVAAAPGYQVYYLWMLAGEGRKLSPCDDPQHAWVKTLE